MKNIVLLRCMIFSIQPLFIIFQSLNIILIASIYFINSKPSEPENHNQIKSLNKVTIKQDVVSFLCGIFICFLVEIYKRITSVT